MALQATPVEAKQVLAKNIRAGLVSMLKGSPGTAKSAIVRELAEEYNLKIIDFRLSQCDPTDLLGFPSINTETNKASYVPFDTFPLEDDELPEGKDGWLIFLDELNGGDRSTQKGAYKLIDDKMVGGKKLHPRVAIIGAGNLDTDAALVEEMSTAMQSRLCHIQIRPDNNNWLDWATGAGIDTRITSFIRFKPSNLYTFDPEKAETQETYACYRTWEFAHKQLQQCGDVLKDPTALLTFAGSLGEGVAREFMAFMRIYSTLPTIISIISNPNNIEVPKEPGTQYALSGALAQNADADNIDPIMEFTNRLPMEFQVITIRDMLKRSPALKTSAPIKLWVATNNKELY